MTGSIELAFGLCAAQDGNCFYCGVRFTGKAKQGGTHIKATQWTRDHLLPRSAGHGNTRNLILACVACNQAKADRPATQEQIEKAARIHARALNLEAAFMGGNSWWTT